MMNFHDRRTPLSLGAFTDLPTNRPRSPPATPPPPLLPASIVAQYEKIIVILSSHIWTSIVRIENFLSAHFLQPNSPSSDLSPCLHFNPAGRRLTRRAYTRKRERTVLSSSYSHFGHKKPSPLAYLCRCLAEWRRKHTMSIYGSPPLGC